MGSLLFALALHPFLESLSSLLVLGYLDDITLGGDADKLSAYLDIIQSLSDELGLSLNVNKCEIIHNDNDPIPPRFAGFKILSRTPANFSVHRCAMCSGAALDVALATRCADLRRASDRLSLLSAHDALLILKYSISAPKLLYTLRCSPCSGHQGLDDFDQILRTSLSRVTNVDIDNLGWIQASLPVGRGGLGIRSVGLLAPSAFLASAAATRDLQTALLPSGFGFPDPDWDLALSTWSARYNTEIPAGTAQAKQKSWDEASITTALEILTAGHTDPYHRARLLASQAPHSGDWLHAWPITACGLRLDNEAIRVAVGLRIGANLCSPHTCSCGALVDARGSHGLSCHRSAGRQPRHAQLNDAVHRALIRAGIPSHKEPVGLMRDDGGRPDGCTLVSWDMGKCLAWDVTVRDTLAMSHLPETSLVAGAASERGAKLKNEKYRELSRSYLFCAIALETLGPINEEGASFLLELGRRLSASSGDPRETAFLFQRLSIIVQRCNSICFRGTFENLVPEH